jgi:hypothetical protein
LAFVPGTNGQNALYNLRHFNVVSHEAWHESYTGFVHKVDLTGNDQVNAHSNYMGDLMQGTSNSTVAQDRIMDNTAINLNYQYNYLNSKLVVDSQKYMFMSVGNFVVNKLGETKSYVLKKLKLSGAFAIVEAGNLRYIFYPTPPRMSYVVIDMSKMSPTAGEDEFVSTAKALCLPGTSLGSVWDVAVSQSGDLVIADSSNSRVLMYRIRDNTGNLVLKEQGSASCPK